MVLEVDCRARHAPLNELLKALVRHEADAGGAGAGAGAPADNVAVRTVSMRRTLGGS
jgi:hypothetical protein